MKLRLRVGIAVESWNHCWKLESWVKKLESQLSVESWIAVESAIAVERWKTESRLKVAIAVEHWKPESLLKSWIAFESWTLQSQLKISPVNFEKRMWNPLYPLATIKQRLTLELDTWPFHLTFPGAIATASWLINGDVRLQLWQKGLRVLYYGLFSHQEYSANKLLDGLVTNYIYNRLQDKSYLHIM